MYSFVAENVNQGLQFAIEHLLQEGVEEPSRNGSVIAAPGPVCIEFVNPRERVLYSPTRDANPVFHFMESLWMLAGSNEIEFPVYFSSGYAQYSDDGSTMWDAYGWRWKGFFGYDQLEVIIEELRRDSTSRRCVLGMWNSAEYTAGNGPDPTWKDREELNWQSDLYVATNGGKAVPCNTQAYFAIRNGKLNMTLLNRSNDLLFGMLGANAVHFSFLLEYMAMRIGVPIGSLYQFTNNMHAYTAKFSREKLDQIAYECIALEDLPTPTPDLGPALEEGFDEDLRLFMSWALSIIRAPVPPATWPLGARLAEGVGRPGVGTGGSYVPLHPSTALALNVPDLKTAFMQSVAVPMFLFWVYRKWKDEYSSQTCLAGIDAPDWYTACKEWAERREK